MSNESIARKISAAFVVCILASSSARGTLITAPNGVVTPVSPPVSGTVIVPGVPIGFAVVAPDGYTGTLTSAVYQESPADNPLGGLTFVYDLHNNNSSATALAQLVIPDFSGISTDVSYAATGQAPTSTIRETDALVLWDFSGGLIAPGSTSGELIIRTDASFYDLTPKASVIDDLPTSVATIGPSLITNITPEPASLGLIVIGALALRRARPSA